MKNRLDLALTGLALMVPVLGCTDAAPSPPVEQEQSPIINGKLSSESDNAVVSVSGKGAGCTGTLLAPTVVLTALHCVSEYDANAAFRCRPDGTLEPGSSGGQLGPLYDPPDVVSVRYGVRPDTREFVRAKALFGTGSDTACHDDIAVVVLDAPPPIGDAPFATLRFHSTSTSELARIVGYGSTQGTSTVTGRQARQPISLLGVGADPWSAGDSGIVPRTIMIGEGACHGDSGGPLFSLETGALIGVYSLLLAGTCVGNDVTNTYTAVAPYESLIREALASVGEEPIVEPPPATGAGGGAGAGGEPGEPGTAGVPGEGGAPSAAGGTGATVGTGGSGGSGARGGTSTGATGGDSATGGDGGTVTKPRGTGSGSRRDSGCVVSGGTSNAKAGSLGLLAFVAWVFARRRRQR